MSKLVFSHCAGPEKRYHVSRHERLRAKCKAERPKSELMQARQGAAIKKRGRRNSGLLHKETKMSREDDFFGDYDESSNDVDTGQEDTSEPLLDESPDEPEAEPVFEEPPRPASPR